MMKLIFTLLILLSAFLAKAQTEDYVITTKGDTIRCYVYVSSFNSAKYKTPDGKTQKIVTTNIKEYYQTPTDTRFRAVHRDSSLKAEFLRVLENGPISFHMSPGGNYGLLGALTVSPTSMLIAKGNDKAVTLKTTGLLNSKTRQQRKDTLAVMLEDKPTIYEMYKDESNFTSVQILNLIHLYNTGQPYKAPEKKRDPNAKKDDIYN